MKRAQAGDVYAFKTERGYRIMFVTTGDPSPLPGLQPAYQIGKRI